MAGEGKPFVIGRRQGQHDSAGPGTRQVSPRCEHAIKPRFRAVFPLLVGQVASHGGVQGRDIKRRFHSHAFQFTQNGACEQRINGGARDRQRGEITEHGATE